MLEGHEPSRLRYLADKDKQVVQQYMSEKTYTGNSNGLATGTNSNTGSGSGSGSGGAVVAGVAGVAVIGGLGATAWMWYAKKGCFGAKSAASNMPPVNTGANANANMQSAV